MELLLGKHELIDFGADLRGVSIICREGRCWITQAGDSRDHILSVGDRFMVNNSGQLIINATETCRLVLNEMREKNQPSWFAKIICAALSCGPT